MLYSPLKLILIIFVLFNFIVCPSPNSDLVYPQHAKQMGWFLDSRRNYDEANSYRCWLFRNFPNCLIMINKSTNSNRVGLINVISVHRFSSWGKGICIMFLKSFAPILHLKWIIDGNRMVSQGKWLFSYGSIISEVRKIKTLARSGPFHNKWSWTWR